MPFLRGANAWCELTALRAQLKMGDVGAVRVATFEVELISVLKFVDKCLPDVFAYEVDGSTVNESTLIDGLHRELATAENYR